MLGMVISLGKVLSGERPASLPNRFRSVFPLLEALPS